MYTYNYTKHTFTHIGITVTILTIHTDTKIISSTCITSTCIYGNIYVQVNYILYVYTMHTCTCTVHADIMSIAKIYNKYNVTFFSWVPAQEKVNACAH